MLFAFAAKLGANAVLGVSLAVCKAGAAQKVRVVGQFLQCSIVNMQCVCCWGSWCQKYN